MSCGLYTFCSASWMPYSTQISQVAKCVLSAIAYMASRWKGPQTTDEKRDDQQHHPVYGWHAQQVSALALTKLKTAAGMDASGLGLALGFEFGPTTMPLASRVSWCDARLAGASWQPRKGILPPRGQRNRDRFSGMNRHRRSPIAIWYGPQAIWVGLRHRSQRAFREKPHTRRPRIQVTGIDRASETSVRSRSPIQFSEPSDRSSSKPDGFA